ncbi:phosphodiester glycosidase family protein [Algibacter miyuki]|uniref:Phosphodiester glycosidase family protein n=1 Tax=Algibacter miyuki TaxID=1306933 RepID=A0ABV5GZ29_9FLAO|nr:phosphodiester glycosidase family protein [Algibacter miyuki]MDN3666921.1 phosphodiester glycosidase family protein [Algibacter miyuki]
MKSQELVNDLYNGDEKRYFIETNTDTLTLYHKQINDRSSFAYGLELYYLKIPLNSAKLNVKEVKIKGEMDSIYNEFKTLESIVLISGGFWGYDKSNKEMPLGLIIENGNIKSKKIKWETGGFLFQKDNSIDIVAIKDLDEVNFDEAIQSKPILVKNFENDIYSDDKIHFDRICIGITNSNELIICAVFNNKGRSISLYEFSEILIKNEKPDYPNTKIALALDGGPSSHLYFPALNMHVGYQEINYVPNIITIKN